MADGDGISFNAHLYSALLYAAEKAGPGAKEEAQNLVKRLRSEGVVEGDVLGSQIAKVAV